VLSLELLGPRHEAAVLAFERGNRAYFAKSISDRGDSFFQQFSERHRELMAEQEAGAGAFYVFVDEYGEVVGRFNLYDCSDGTAVVGYRVGERVSGRGVATSGLRKLCRIAREDIGLQMLTAATDDENVASRRVLAKVGFVLVGPTEVGGRHGSEFKLDLAIL
jgi:[ribosomal protein S5]-alanine N-acetyltransferase